MDRDATPAVKGFILASLWEDLRSLLERGRLSRQAAERRLGARDLEILDGKVEPSLWYPNETYVGFSDLIAEAAGSVDDAFWIARGRRAGERLLGAESVLGRFVEGVSGKGANAGRALMKFPNLMFNYGRWEYESPRRGEFSVHLRDAAPLPDSLRFSIQGAGEVIGARLVGAPVQVTSRRPSEDYVVFEGRFGRIEPR
jgi:hypothetical protein